MQSLWKLVLLSLKILVVMASLVGGILLGLNLYSSYFALPTGVEVPKLVGLDQAKAQELAEKLNLKLDIRENRYDKKVPKNRVMEQDPPPGREVRQGREVSVVVSMGPETVVVPDVTGQPLREARILLENARLRLGKVVRGKMKAASADEVLDQKPAPGTRIKRGTKVTVTVSSGGRAAVRVPNYEGLKLEEVQKRLEEDGLELGTVSWVIRKDAPAGEVVRQSPAPRTLVAWGSPMELLVNASADVDGFEVRRKAVEFLVPPGPGSRDVRIEVNDVSGTTVVYDSENSPGQRVRVDVTSVGDGEYVIYADGKLIKRENI